MARSVAQGKGGIIDVCGVAPARFQSLCDDWSISDFVKYLVIGQAGPRTFSGRNNNYTIVHGNIISYMEKK